jgi:intracellular sulfur oxidation DsrE/DsrF family protein
MGINMLENGKRVGLNILMLVALLFYTVSLWAGGQQPNEVRSQMTKLLNSAEPPEGVVFDIETLDANALESVNKYVLNLVKEVKAKFPEVDVVLISHGAEEFALLKSNEASYQGLHDTFAQLVNTQNVSLHVCGAVAGLKKVGQDDFPDFVSYSESGLAQLNDYKAIGYTVITIHALELEQRKELFEHSEKYIAE